MSTLSMIPKILVFLLAVTSQAVGIALMFVEQRIVISIFYNKTIVKLAG